METSVTPIYSELPATHDEPWAVIAAQRARDAERFQRRFSHQEDDLAARDTYPPLPWPLEALPGTHWRNLWTGHEEVAGTLTRQAHPMKWQRPLTLLRQEVRYGGDPLLDNSHIGLWWGERYVIEHWVRVDHLPLAVQLAWYGVEVEYQRRHSASIERGLAELIRHGDRLNSAHGQRQLVRARKQLVERLASMRVFAEAHQLVVTPDLLNGPPAPDAPGRRDPGDEHPAQLQLFA